MVCVGCTKEMGCEDVLMGRIVKVVMAVEVGFGMEVSEVLGTSFHEGRMVLSLVDPHGLSPVNKELNMQLILAPAALAAFL